MTESEFRALRKNAHICRDCGKEDAYTIYGRTYCFDCAEKQRLHKQAIRETEEEKIRIERTRRKQKNEEKNKDYVNDVENVSKKVDWLNESGLSDKERKNREWKRKTERLIG